MTDIESRVRDSRQEILRCIKEPAIVSYLQASSVISPEDGSRLKTMYLSGETTKAGEEMLECIIDSNEPGKWTSFIEALENAEYPYLKELFLCSDSEANNHLAEHAKKVFRLFTPSLEKSIIPCELIPELHAREVINREDRDLIIATERNRGTTAAAVVLLERIQCRLSPVEWYREFLSALMKTGNEHLVQYMEPDFVADPSAFGPLQSTISEGKHLNKTINIIRSKDVFLV
ncbi:uncharacterized protein LOC123546057 [Mercenaria mercenaria]|uniref:uncharacterized protein LOC123546057 n=1 Tax=Mercenaria mercenaria TaxID=6596 RepID=UPI00234F2942|nr:uncharacterized protein LOC123546057 [Mercenaria mercenaria]